MASNGDHSHADRNPAPHIQDVSGLAMNKGGQSPGSRRVTLIVAVAVAMALIMLAGLRWSVDHPYAWCWDEATYLNEALFDNQRLEHGMLQKLGGRILIRSAGRPPAYRILALPLPVLFGQRTTAFRLLSLVCLGVSSWFVYLATRRFASGEAAALGVLVFALSPEVVSSSVWFSTEGPLYLATSGMLYYLFVTWTRTVAGPYDWVALGLLLALGFLAKASFLAIAVPILVFWFVLNRWAKLGLPSPVSQVKAALLAAMLAVPWWLLNAQPIIASIRMARGFRTCSLGPPSLSTWIHWVYSAFQGLLGAGVSIVIVLLFVVWLWREFVRKERILAPIDRVALGACGAAGLPIVLAQLSGTNHLLRHISPAVIPLAVGAGVLFDRTGWARSRMAITVSGILFGAQLLMLLCPVVLPNTHPVPEGLVNGRLPWRALARRDQWDWKPLEELARNCGVAQPKIAYMGLGPGLTPPHLEYPWAVRGAATHLATLDWPDVTWLWRFEEGQVDWPKVMEAAEKSDIVLTLPNYSGAELEDNLNNEHNAEFFDRLSHDSHFRGPIHMEVGRFAPIRVEVFLNKNHEEPPPRSIGKESTLTERRG